MQIGGHAEGGNDGQAYGYGATAFGGVTPFRPVVSWWVEFQLTSTRSGSSRKL